MAAVARTVIVAVVAGCVVPVAVTVVRAMAMMRRKIIPARIHDGAVVGSGRITATVAGLIVAASLGDSANQQHHKSDDSGTQRESDDESHGRNYADGVVGLLSVEWCINQ